MQLYHLFYNECKPVSMDILNEFSYKISVPIKQDILPTISTLESAVIPISDNILHKIEQQCMKATHVQDGLFWSIYIAHYGYAEYLRNKYNYGKLEVREKQQVADFIILNCRLKTNYRVTRSFCGEMVADLTSLPRMVFSGLVGMCVYYKSDIYIVDIVKHTYLSFLNTEDTSSGSVRDIIVLYKNPLHTRKFASNEYFIDIGMTVMSIEDILTKYYPLEHYEKPLKGISTYLKTDLEIIAEKTVFQEKPELKTEVHSKQELYNLILIYLSESIV